jgi:outer membrane protein assembly factor BamB
VVCAHPPRRKVAAGLWSISLTALLAAGCAENTVRRVETQQRDYPAGVTALVWRTNIHEQGMFAARPEECATGAVVGDRLIIGSRDAKVVALALDDGRVLWSSPVSGGVDSEARFDERKGQVYVGTDDGSVYAVDPAGGGVRWSYRGKGAIERRAELGGDSIYVTSSADRVVALEPDSGKLRWQYERETPEGFTIHGHAGPRLHHGVVYAGFSDGFAVALNAGTGDVMWARSLAAASEQYVDVDSTPIALGDDTVLASSYSGGLYALSAASGDVKWRLGIEGAGSVNIVDGRLYFAAPRDGIAALTTKGEVLWRQGLAQAGDVTPPLGVGPYLVFSGSRAGLFIVDRATGQLLEVFNPGRGMCAGATVGPDGHTLYILANSGSVYSIALKF